MQNIVRFSTNRRRSVFVSSLRRRVRSVEIVGNALLIDAGPSQVDVTLIGLESLPPLCRLSSSLDSAVPFPFPFPFPSRFPSLR